MTHRQEYECVYILTYNLSVFHLVSPWQSQYYLLMCGVIELDPKIRWSQFPIAQ